MSSMRKPPDGDSNEVNNDTAPPIPPTRRSQLLGVIVVPDDDQEKKRLSLAGRDASVANHEEEEPLPGEMSGENSPIVNQGVRQEDVSLIISRISKEKAPERITLGRSFDEGSGELEEGIPNDASMDSGSSVERPEDEPVPNVSTPGAHAIPGMQHHEESLGNSELLNQGNEGERDQSRMPLASTQQFAVEISAQLVDESAEEERRLELEQQRLQLQQERERNRELESRIEEIESGAVIAIPMDENDSLSMSKESKGGESRNFFIRWWKKNPVRVISIAGLLLVVAVGLILGILLRPSDDRKSSTTANTATLPTSTMLPSLAPTPDAPWIQVGATLDGAVAGDNFGFAVALSGDGAIVAGGAPLNDGNGDGAGHVRVFLYNNKSNATEESSWIQLGQDLEGIAFYDDFGSSVALSRDGDVVAAGAITEPGGKGYVKVFVYDNGTNTWNQMGQNLEGRSVNDWFGGFSTALSADGSVVASGGPGRFVGEIEYDGNKSGYVRIFHYNSTLSEWTRLGQDLNGEHAGDSFGRAVSLSADGKIVAGGADWHGVDGTAAGQVQVYAYNSSVNQWYQLGQSLIGDAPGDRFGYSIALSEDGSIVAAGAVANHGVNGPQSGHVRVFTYDGGVDRWTQLGQDIDGVAEDDLMGFSVALSGNGLVLAAGAAYNDASGRVNTGHVRVFAFNSVLSLWEQVGEVMEGDESFAGFGFSVGISFDGDLVCAGSPAATGVNGAGSGHIRVFEVPERI